MSSITQEYPLMPPLSHFPQSSPLYQSPKTTSPVYITGSQHTRSKRANKWNHIVYTLFSLASLAEQI